MGMEIWPHVVLKCVQKNKSGSKSIRISAEYGAEKPCFK